MACLLSLFGAPAYAADLNALFETCTAADIRTASALSDKLVAQGWRPYDDGDALFLGGLYADIEFIQNYDADYDFIVGNGPLPNDDMSGALDNLKGWHGEKSAKRPEATLNVIASDPNKAIFIHADGLSLETEQTPSRRTCRLLSGTETPEPEFFNKFPQGGYDDGDRAQPHMREWKNLSKKPPPEGLTSFVTQYMIFNHELASSLLGDKVEITAWLQTKVEFAE